MVRRSRRASGSRRTRRRSRHSMKSRRVRRMRHTRGRGRAMKRGGMFSSLNPFSPSIKSHGPVVDNNYYLVDDHGHTPYGVYEYYQKNEGRYFGVALSSDIVFNRWVPRRYVNGSIANSNWAKEGDSLYIDFVKSGKDVEKDTQNATLLSIINHYSRWLARIGTTHRGTLRSSMKSFRVKPY